MLTSTPPFVLDIKSYFENNEKYDSLSSEDQKRFDQEEAIINYLIEEFKKQPAKSQTLSANEIISTKFYEEVKLSHSIEFINVADLYFKRNDELKTKISNLVEQQLEDENAVKKNKLRQLNPYTLYPYNGGFIVLSHGILQTPSKTKNENKYEVVNVLPMLAESLERGPKTISKNLLPSLSSVEAYQKEKTHLAIHKSLLRFKRDPSQNTLKDIKLKTKCIKFKFFIPEKMSSDVSMFKETEEEQKDYDIFFSKKNASLSNRKPVIEKNDEGEIIASRISAPYISGKNLYEYEFKEFNYGDVLTIVSQMMEDLLNKYKFIPGFVHGDYHDGNIKFNNNMISFDFNHSGREGESRTLTDDKNIVHANNHFHFNLLAIDKKYGEDHPVPNKNEIPNFREINYEYIKKERKVKNSYKEIIAIILEGLNSERSNKKKSAQKRYNKAFDQLASLQRKESILFPNKLDQNERLDTEAVIDIEKFRLSVELVQDQIKNDLLKDKKKTKEKATEAQDRFNSFFKNFKVLRKNINNQNCYTVLESIYELKKLGYVINLPSEIDNEANSEILKNFIAFENSNTDFSLYKKKIGKRILGFDVKESDFIPNIGSKFEKLDEYFSRDVKFHFSSLKRDLKKIRSIIKTGIKSEYEENHNLSLSALPDEKYQLAERQLKILKKKFPTVIFPHYSNKKIVEFEKFSLSWELAIEKINNSTSEEDHEQTESLFKKASADYSSIKKSIRLGLSHELNESVANLKKSVDQLKEHKIYILIPKNNLQTFFKDNFGYEEGNKTMVSEVYRKSWDTHYLGVHFDTLLKDCRKVSGAIDYKEMKGLAKKMLQNEVKNEHDLKETLKIVYKTSMRQLRAEIQKLQEVIMENKNIAAKGKERCQDDEIKSSAYNDLEKELSKTAEQFENIYQTVNTSLANNNKNNLERWGELTREIQKKYENEYKKLQTLVEDPKWNKLDGDRFTGIKSALKYTLMIITRPWSCIMGGMLKLIGKDRKHICESGFMFERSKSSKEKYKIRRSVELFSEKESVFLSKKLSASSGVS